MLQVASALGADMTLIILHLLRMNKLSNCCKEKVLVAHVCTKCGTGDYQDQTQHLCTELPCPVADKECADKLQAGMEAHYIDQGHIEDSTPVSCGKECDTLTDKLTDLVNEIANNGSKILDEFCKAYLAETGLKPSEVELIQTIGNDGIVTWKFKKLEL